jgi:hypothetical protein
VSDLRTVPHEFLLYFIEIHKQQECLWKVKSKEYSDCNNNNDNNNNNNNNNNKAAYELLTKSRKSIQAQTIMM